MSAASISAQATVALQDGFGLVFERWMELQMAVENQWGGRAAATPVPRPTSSLHLSWFTYSNSKDFEDGSVADVGLNVYHN